MSNTNSVSNSDNYTVSTNYSTNIRKRKSSDVNNLNPLSAVNKNKSKSLKSLKNETNTSLLLSQNIEDDSDDDSDDDDEVEVIEVDKDVVNEIDDDFVNVDCNDYSITVNNISDLQSEYFNSMFSVYWQNRLVPYSVVNSLPFFKNMPLKILDCNNQNISENWKFRLKGFLFFDWTSHNISNNKLKLTVEPSLDGFLNDDSNAKKITWSPSTTSVLFKK